MPTAMWQNAFNFSKVAETGSVRVARQYVFLSEHGNMFREDS
jgi:hypothetical protein